jgi:prepilin signal peptidase PulO-like enzyme (type II secretory pathway)
VLIVFCFVLIVGLLVGLIITVLLSSKQRKGKLGINFDQCECPSCHNVLPILRFPTSLRQTLWGGWTCNNCGVEVDKWGNAVEISKTKLR